MLDDWKYYNHSWIPTCPPHMLPDLCDIKNGKIFSKGGILARYTTDFDCGYNTEWWYIIKDTKFDISNLKSKRRYEINKGIKNFYVERIDASKYCEELYEVQVEAFSAYPKKYRPHVDKDLFIDDIIKNWQRDDILVYGAFFRSNDALCGYAFLRKKRGYWDFSVLKTRPCYEKFAVNAAIINKILEDFNSAKDIDNALYICDGGRSIFHETAFQDYLEKYFGFRKAYCLLEIIYNPKYKLIVKFLYLFRKILRKFDGVGIVHKINGILKMEEIVRGQKKK